MKKLYLFLVFFLLSGTLFAQIINMHTHGHKDTVLSHTILYDDGGKTGAYSNNCNATYTFHTVNPNNRFLVKVYANLHGIDGFDRSRSSLLVFDGDTNELISYYENNRSNSLKFSNWNNRWYSVHDNLGNYIYAQMYGYYSDSNSMTVKFSADDDNPTNGFEIHIEEIGCINPVVYIGSEFEDTTHTRIYWEEDDTTVHWQIDYKRNFFDAYNYTDLECSFADTSNTWITIYSDTNFVILDNPNRYQYDVVIHKTDDTISYCGGIILGCPYVYAQNLQYTRDNDSIYLTWENSTLDTVDWLIYYSYRVGIGHYAHTTDTFYSIYSNASSCDSNIGTIYVVGNDPDNNIWVCNERWIYPPALSCPEVGRMWLNESSDTSLTLSWWDIDTIGTYIIAYREAQYPEDSNLYDTVTTQIVSNENWRKEVTHTIYGLNEATDYDVTIYTLCQNSSISCNGYTEHFTTSINNCIDYTDIWDTLNTHLTWGTYDNPYRYPDSLRNNPYASYINCMYCDTNGLNCRYTNAYFYPTDRHTPITDTSPYSYDDRTVDYNSWNGNGYNIGLKKVPEGMKASMRLGNESSGAEGESITYDYYVDTLDKDMLVLKYAVVLQNPNHTRENQPHFTLEILDSTGGVIDTQCCYADFYAAGDLGWNTGNSYNPNIIWKDWTTVGIDLAPYQDQKIKIRLTTTDCGEGGHFGYAYFTIACDNKKIYLVNKCDSPDSIWLEAPLGFDYIWTKQGDTTVISREYKALVPMDSNVYECLASFVGKPDCNFTMHTVSIPVTPKAGCRYTIDTCDNSATLINESFLDMDSTFNAITRQYVDSTWWAFEDGSIHYGDTLTRHFDTNGDYTITIYAHLASSTCVDSLVIPFSMHYLPDININFDSAICYGDTLNLEVTGINDTNAKYLWSTSDSTKSVSIVPTTSKSYNIEINSYGCTYYDTVFSIVNKIYNDTIFDTICQGDTLSVYSFEETSTGFYRDTLQSVYGCDSIVNLNLFVCPTYDTIVIDSVCQNSTYSGYNIFNIPINSYAGNFVYDSTIHTQYGCDSVIHLHLSVIPVHDSTIFDTICAGDMYSSNGFNESVTGLYTDSLLSISGCDSIVHLNLFVRDSIIVDLYDTICQKETYYRFIDTMISISNPGDYILQYDTISISTGCDSLTNMHLYVAPTYDTTLTDNICAMQKYTNFGFIIEPIANAGTYNFDTTLNTYLGCDSVIHLILTVRPSYNDTIEAYLCDMDYDSLNFYETASGFYTQSLSSIYGCDSVVNLNYIRYPVFTDSIEAEIYQGEVYTEHGFEAKTEGVTSVVYQDTNGCDSTYVLTLTVIDLHFPNVVTPNGDGINDVYDIHDLLKQTMFDYTCLKIYNRSGKMIYMKENIKTKDDCWDPDATNAPTGTYFYRFTAKSKTKNIDVTGNIEVLR